MQMELVSIVYTPSLVFFDSRQPEKRTRTTPAAITINEMARYAGWTRRLKGSGAVEVNVQFVASDSHAFVTGNISNRATKAMNNATPVVDIIPPAFIKFSDIGDHNQGNSQTAIHG